MLYLQAFNGRDGGNRTHIPHDAVLGIDAGVIN